jgi:hypothetical protein
MNLELKTWAFLSAVGIVTFFLRDLFERFKYLEKKQTTENKEVEEKIDATILKYSVEFGRLKGQIDKLDLRTSGELRRLEETMKSNFRHESDKLEEIQRILERFKN